MKVNLQISTNPPAKSEVVAVPVTSDEMKRATKSRSSSTKTLSSGGLRGLKVDLKKLGASGFKGKLGEVQLQDASSGEGLVFAVGVGDKKELGAEKMRKAASALVRKVKSANHFTNIASYLVDVLSAKEQVAGIRSHSEGIVMGSYAFNEYKSTSKTSVLKRVRIVAPKNSEVKTAELSTAVRQGEKIGEAVNFARDLVNEPGGSLTPKEFAARAQSMARKTGLQCKVWNLAAIKKAKMGGLLGVNRGSIQEPRFVELTYTPKSAAKGHLALVGKGITFDSGGLSLKPPNAMMTMKCDMGGGAAVLGAMSALSIMKLPIKVSAYVPMTDNMTGGDATRPGDVLTTHNKKTVEVLNTDAEGRLILADALSIASKNKPDAILDLATLTGACVVALGEDIAGLLGNNDDWNKQVLKASKQSEEKVWELPLVSEYKEQLESPIADLKNIGSNYGGTITAALFLSEFVEKDIPWAHLDIAGPAYIDKAKPSGGTGFGVRLIVDLASSFKKPK